MQSDDAFAMIFPGLTPNGKIGKDAEEGFPVKEKPYTLLFKNISGTWSNCDFCGQTKCSGCPVPYTDETTIGMVLSTIKQDSANSFYKQDYKMRGKELILNLVWHQDINKTLFSFLATAVKFESTEAAAEAKSADVNLIDCLREFK
jgi:hypothetical protein